MDIHEQLNERLARAVGRFIYHCEGAGLDTRQLDGEVVLVFRGGQLDSLRRETNLRGSEPARRYMTADEQKRAGIVDEDDWGPDGPQMLTEEEITTKVAWSERRGYGNAAGVIDKDG